MKRQFLRATGLLLLGWLTASGVEPQAQSQTNRQRTKLVVKEVSLGKVPILANTRAMVMSPDKQRVAYPVMRRGQYVVSFGKEEWGGPDDRVGALTFSPDGRRFAYTAKRSNSVFVVADSMAGPKLDDIGGSVFSPDSRHLAYAARRNEKMLVVMDGEEAKGFPEIFALRFESPNRVSALVALDEFADNELLRVQINIATEE
jgi:hypothetical protein